MILAAEITVDATTSNTCNRCLTRPVISSEPGVTELPETGNADAGYWHRAIQAITDRGIEVLIRPDGNMGEGKRPGREIGFCQPTAESADGPCGRSDAGVVAACRRHVHEGADRVEQFLDVVIEQRVVRRSSSTALVRAGSGPLSCRSLFMLASGGRSRGCTCQAWLHGSIAKPSCRPGVAALRHRSIP